MGQHPDPGSAGDPDPDPEPPASNGGSPAPASPAQPGSPDPGSAGDPAPGVARGQAAPGARADAGPGAEAGVPSREETLAGFARGGSWDKRLPGPELGVALAAAVGPDGRCRGASGEQLIGMLNRIAAQEAWNAAGKLAVIRALVRDDDPAFLCKSRHGDLPDVWDPALAREVGLALAASAASADKLMRTAWELQARLPEVGALLQNGTLDLAKARLVTEIFAELTDEDAGRAEALLVAELTVPPAKTYAQVERAATAIALIVDPRSGERRRKAAEQRDARVRLYREQSGTAAIEGRDLPAAQALAAYASADARAKEYKASGVFGKAGMDRLRATAFLDLLTGVSAAARIACGLLAEQEPGEQADSEPAAGAGAPGRPGGDACPCAECDGSCLPPDDSPDDDPGDDPGDGDGDDPDSGGTRPGAGRDDPDGGGRDSGPRPDSGPGPAPAPAATPTPPDDQVGSRPAVQDLVIPLVTLARLADRPGEGHGLGALDPALCRALAAIAVRSPHTTLCLTITNADGIAIGHGCAKPARTAGSTGSTGTPGTAGTAREGPPAASPLVALPSRINLTITTSQLRELSQLRQPGRQPPAGWTLAPHTPRPHATQPRGTSPPRPTRQPRPPGQQAPPGDPDWCTDWTLTLPDGRPFTVRLEPVPTYDCDHRHESHAYQPNDRLRHLVQVRDHVCTFPTCNRHARDSDFEHAVPYDKGGRTCACNAGARSRQCHRVKQAPGWNLTQPKPGFHAWTTPRGRTYTQGPNRYPI